MKCAAHIALAFNCKVNTFDWCSFSESIAKRSTNAYKAKYFCRHVFFLTQNIYSECLYVAAVGWCSEVILLLDLLGLSISKVDLEQVPESIVAAEVLLYTWPCALAGETHTDWNVTTIQSYIIIFLPEHWVRWHFLQSLKGGPGCFWTLKCLSRTSCSAIPAPESQFLSPRWHTYYVSTVSSQSSYAIQYSESALFLCLFLPLIFLTFVPQQKWTLCLNSRSALQYPFISRCSHLPWTRVLKATKSNTVASVLLVMKRGLSARHLPGHKNIR